MYIEHWRFHIPWLDEIAKFGTRGFDGLPSCADRQGWDGKTRVNGALPSLLPVEPLGHSREARCRALQGRRCRPLREHAPGFVLASIARGRWQLIPERIYGNAVILREHSD